MSGVRVTIDSLRLSFSGLSPEAARGALDGLDRDLAARLEARLRASPAFGRGLEARGRASAGASGSGTTRVAAEVRAGMDAGALRGMIAERLLDILAESDPAASPRAEAGSLSEGRT